MVNDLKNLLLVLKTHYRCPGLSGRSLTFVTLSHLFRIIVCMQNIILQPCVFNRIFFGRKLSIVCAHTTF